MNAGVKLSTHRFPFDHRPVSQMVHEPALQFVRRRADRAPVVREHVSDADVHVIALRKHVRIALGCAAGTFVRRGALPVARGLVAVRHPKVDGSRSRNTSRGVSSIMSRATDGPANPD